MSYIFRREDDGDLVEVPFEIMIQQDSGGYITLTDGIQAKRCVHLEMTRDNSPAKRCTSTDGEFLKPIVSDALGCTAHGLAELEADRKAHGFSGVEFVQDPREPGFFQAKFQSRSEWTRYMKHRGMYDRSSKGAVNFLSEEDFAKAAELASRSVKLSLKR